MRFGDNSFSGNGTKVALSRFGSKANGGSPVKGARATGAYPWLTYWKELIDGLFSEGDCCVLGIKRGGSLHLIKKWKKRELSPNVIIATG